MIKGEKYVSLYKNPEYFYSTTFTKEDVSRYKELGECYYQNKEYAGVIKNEELRFASADTDIKFDGIVQAQTMLAIQKKKEEFFQKCRME